MSGVTYAPLLDWINAGVWANYKVFDFFDLEGDQQSLIVAAYRTNKQIDAILAREAQKDAARRAKSKRR